MTKKTWFEIDQNGLITKIGGICKAKDFKRNKND